MTGPSVWTLFGILVLVGGAGEGIAQQAPAQPSDTTRIVTASFAEPARPADPAHSRTLGGCINVFKRAISLNHYDHPPDLTPAHDTLLMGEQNWIPYPPDAIEAARRCYHAVYPTAGDLADADVAAAWPLVIALNDDALTAAVGARYLALAGSNPTARAARVVQIVRDLANSNPYGDRTWHVTDTHLALARQYLGQLEAMGPSQVLSWLKALDIIKQVSDIAGSGRLDSDARIQAALGDMQHALDVMHAIPPGTLSGADAQALRTAEVTTRTYGVQRLTYLKTLDRADLRRYIALVDSGWPGGTRPWLVGTKAAPITADYWFGTPSGKAPAAVPVPNALTLIVFVNPEAGQPGTGKDAVLRRLHAKFPALQIVLIGVTDGVWANESLLEHPEREAQLMYQYVHDSLQVPGIMGIVRGQQRVVTSDGKTLPVQFPVFDRYMVDVKYLMGQPFLIDRDGVVVDEGQSLAALVPRLLATHARSSIP
jgi:hypothetical protein